MSRTVECSRYKKEMPGLEKPPVPGPNGEKIFNQVSQQAWQEWQALQTMLINEKHLSLIDPDARKYLGEQMWLFFEGGEVDRAEGYVPENDG